MMKNRPALRRFNWHTGTADLHRSGNCSIQTKSFPEPSQGFQAKGVGRGRAQNPRMEEDFSAQSAFIRVQKPVPILKNSRLQ
jgi:hypothetical protein